MFAFYLAAVPAYGARPELLFGFLFLIDAGLLAIAIARRQELLHAVGAIATMLVTATWMAVWTRRIGCPRRPRSVSPRSSRSSISSRRSSPPASRGPSRARPCTRTMPGLCSSSRSRCSRRSSPSFVSPWLLMGPLIALVVFIAWRAIAAAPDRSTTSPSFFAIATQAVWSATHLTLERLGTAVTIYVAFGLVSLGVPVVARRASRPLQPAWGGGVVLLLGLGLLFFLSLGPVAPAALWALALLLAITNAALFVESAAGRLPIISQVGSVLRGSLLMTWWARAAGSVGVLPSLLVAVGLTLVTLAGHTWSVRSVRPVTRQPPRRRSRVGSTLGSSVISSWRCWRWIASGRCRRGRCLRRWPP